MLITGGAGFIGTNTALHFANNSWRVIILDDLSRPGVETNLALLQKYIPSLQFIHSSINNVDAYKNELSAADVVIHLAGQTAVTTSIVNPKKDFETNVLGTFQLLEAVRERAPNAILIFASTNKVYGDLHTHTITKNEELKCWENGSFPQGIDESVQLDFLSPYGVSKGTADQYCKDWAHSYGIRTVVFRQSCIYGPYQMGLEDQGWVAHLSKQILEKKPIIVYGDGYQVRDLLFVEDLTRAYELAIDHIDTIQGSVFNIGGGPKNAYSLLNVLDILREKEGITNLPISFQAERLADQKYYVSNNGLFSSKTSWKPEMQFMDGVSHMILWQKQHLLKTRI